MARFVSKKQTTDPTSIVNPSKKIKCEYAVTFEFSIRLPVTIRGEVEASALHLLAVKAIKEARIKAKTPESIKKYGAVGSWSSVVVLLDRYKFKASKDETKKDNTNEEV